MGFLLICLYRITGKGQLGSIAPFYSVIIDYYRQLLSPLSIPRGRGGGGPAIEKIEVGWGRLVSELTVRPEGELNIQVIS